MGGPSNQRTILRKTTGIGRNDAVDSMPISGQPWPGAAGSAAMSAVGWEGERGDIAAPAPYRRAWTRRAFGRDWQLAWIFLAPLVVVLVGLVAYPFFSGIWLSFQHKVVGREA